jgi:short-subunit dehydrogenase
MKKILITGASRGIGRAIAIELAKSGYSLVLTSRTESDLRKVAEECISFGVKVDYYISDLSSLEAGVDSAKFALNRFDNIEGIILNAGISTSKRFENNSIEDIQKELGVNYLAPVGFIKEFIPYFKTTPNSSIIVISSFSALTPFPANSTYAATKSAIYSLCNSLRFELSEYGIHVGVVLPGGTKTDMTKEFESIPFIMDTAESVAFSVKNCLEKKESIVIPGMVYSTAALAYKFFQNPIDIALDFAVKNIFPKLGK